MELQLLPAKKFLLLPYMFFPAEGIQQRLIQGSEQESMYCFVIVCFLKIIVSS